MTRVIIHAGFHKTATSSLQEFLSQNRAALKPYFDYYSYPDFPTVGTTSRVYGQRPYPWRLRQFRHAFREFLVGIPDASTIILSRETFSGVMPGHRDVFRRLITNQSRTTVTLAREIIRELRRHFGITTDIQFLFTTRARDPWLRSVYGHLLRSIHLKDDFETFRSGFAIPPDPERDAQSIATSLAPIPVYIARLEDFTDQPEGTAAAILDLVDVPDHLRETLHRAQHHNKGQSPEIEQEFLNLNRSGQSKIVLKTIKDRILKTGHTL